MRPVRVPQPETPGRIVPEEHLQHVARLPLAVRPARLEKSDLDPGSRSLDQGLYITPTEGFLKDLQEARPTRLREDLARGDPQPGEDEE